MSIEEVKGVLEAHGKALDDFQGKVLSRVDRLEDEITSLAQGSDLVKDGGGGSRSPLMKLATDAGIAAVRSGNARSGIVKLSASIPSLEIKTVVGDSGSSEDDALNVQPQRMPGIANFAARPLTLLQAMRRMQVTSSVFEFNAFDSYSNLADYQAAQGDQKAATSMPTELKQANIATIAHYQPVTRQVLADVPSFLAQASDVLRYGCLQKLERELVQGVGGSGKIAGLTHLDNHTACSYAGSSLAEAVATASADLNTAGWNATAVIVHPDTWKSALTERTDSGVGPYLAGSWAAPAAPQIWSVPVITSPWLDPLDYVLLDGSQVWLLDRADVVVEVGMQGSDFIENKATILAEIRAGLAVFAQSAIRYGTLSS